MVVAQGTPEEIAANTLSYTGKFLAPVQEKGKKAKAKGKAGVMCIRLSAFLGRGEPFGCRLGM
jgi:hypothetical protein